ncbi:MAG: hypothetical protein U5L72_16820 [Bacteroidales bacterium]|nr:hypothetical protein [Bacteroidales bacterium]
MTTYTSRKGEVPCSDGDLYAFLTDMRNLKTVIPNGLITDWEATEDHCSFRLDKTGRISASLSEALPHSLIIYDAETFITGRITVQVAIGYITNFRSAIPHHGTTEHEPSDEDAPGRFQPEDTLTT